MKDEVKMFAKKHDFLICVDSDGCAMDTMTYKHEKAFCPKLIQVYKLAQYEKIITEYWLRINLYSATRGVNRFKGLAMTLQMLLDNKIETPNAKELIDFVNSSPVLSSDAIKNAINSTKSEGLRLALLWSNAVNEEVEKLANLSKPFNNCKNALEQLHGKAHIAVVSSANGAAVEQEWIEHGLAPYTDIRYGQEAGSKAACIKALLSQGFENSNTLMIGDALGDLDAAQKNEVLFFPILVGNEANSWQNLIYTAVPAFFSHKYCGEMQSEFIKQQASILK